jgi:hypothetical protein
MPSASIAELPLRNAATNFAAAITRSMAMAAITALGFVSICAQRCLLFLVSSQSGFHSPARFTGAPDVNNPVFRAR